MSLARVERYRLSAANEIQQYMWCTEISHPPPKKQGPKILHMVVGSLYTIWHKQHPKNCHRIELCLPLSNAGLSLEVYAGESNPGYFPTATKATASLLILLITASNFTSFELLCCPGTEALLAMNFHVQEVWWHPQDNFQKNYSYYFPLPTALVKACVFNPIGISDDWSILFSPCVITTALIRQLNAD